MDTGRPCPDGFSYTSDANPQRLSMGELRRMLGLAELDPEPISSGASMHGGLESVEE
jgi:hypothetical protein